MPHFDMQDAMEGLYKAVHKKNSLLALNCLGSVEMYARLEGKPMPELKGLRSLIYSMRISEETDEAEKAISSGNYTDAEIAVITIEDLSEKSGEPVPELDDIKKRTYELAVRKEKDNAGKESDPLKRTMAENWAKFYGQKLAELNQS